jgi:hypothetical protein
MQRLVRRPLGDAGDAGGRPAVEDGLVLGAGDLDGRLDQRIEIGIGRAALGGLQLGA